MKFDSEVFISYAHLDNQPAWQGREWITDFHRHLNVLLGRLLGKEPQIWRDPKLHGNDDFAEALLERLKHVAVMVSVLSPSYINSQWTRRELHEFCQAANESGGLEVEQKTRVFKVIKTPVPRNLEFPPLTRLLGYEFYQLDPNSGRPRALEDPNEKEYWQRIDDMAHDICQILDLLNNNLPASTPGKAVYLAETGFDLISEYNAVKRDLQQHGYDVLPSRPLPLASADLLAFVRAEMARCDLSIQLVGKEYSMVPEDGKLSIMEVQDDEAIARAEKGQFSRLVWIPPGLTIEDPRQFKFVQNLRLNPRAQSATDLLETSLEDLRSVIHERLTQKPAAKSEPAAAPAGTQHLKQLYLIFDKQDVAAVEPWQNFLFDHFEIVPSVFEGDEADIREFHEENLRTCDAVLILYGAGNEIWLRRKLRELQKSSALGRTQPFAAVGIAVVPPLTPQKEHFKTHEALIIPQSGGFSEEPFHPFLKVAKTG